jgi:hypothetical protein
MQYDWLQLYLQPMIGLKRLDRLKGHAEQQLQLSIAARLPQEVTAAAAAEYSENLEIHLGAACADNMAIFNSKDVEAFDDDTIIDLNRLPAKDREAIMARVTPDDSTAPDAFTLAQNEIRREVICEIF